MSSLPVLRNAIPYDRSVQRGTNESRYRIGLYRLIIVTVLLLLLASCYIYSAPTPFINYWKAFHHGNSDVSPHEESVDLLFFRVHPQRPLQNNDFVYVAFQYSHPPAHEKLDDYIGVYCKLHENDPVKPQEFIDRAFVHHQTAGNITFGPLINMRCVWQFAFIDSTTNEAIALSPSLSFRKSISEPLQIHLSLTENRNEMAVQWISSMVQRPIVMYGTEMDKLTHMKEARHVSYQASDMCVSPATTLSPPFFRDPGQIYTSVMTNISTEVLYYYRVGDEAESMSTIRSFYLPPLAGKEIMDQTLSFFVFGDLASPRSSTSEYRDPRGCGATMSLIEKDVNLSRHDPQAKHRYMAVIHVGDLAYARGSTYKWDQFGFLIESVASIVPYMIAVGNHDYGYLENASTAGPYHDNPVLKKTNAAGFDSGGECGIPTEKRFRMPHNGNSVYWYSFDTGLVHHIILSSEHDIRPESPMIKWLIMDLQKVNRRQTPWLILYIHRPLYCSVAYAGDYDRTIVFRKYLEPILSTYRVDIVFAGHYHSYERTCPVYDETCYYSKAGWALAPVHVMVGSGGANVDTWGYYDSEWSLFARKEYGYTRLHIHNTTHAQIEFMSNAQESVRDTFWIQSDHQWPKHRIKPERYWTMAQIAGFVILSLICIIASFYIYRLRSNSSYEIVEEDVQSP